MSHLRGDAGWRMHAGASSAASAATVSSRPMSDWTHIERDAAGHFASEIRDEDFRARRRSRWSWYKQRHADLTAVIKARIAPDATIPETDDAADLIRVMAYHLQAVHGPENLMPALDEWCRDMAPWARFGVSDLLLFIIEDVSGRRRDLTAMRAGVEMRLTWEERCRFDIRTIRPFDLSPAEFRERVRERKLEADRLRAAERRRRQGATDRASWLAENAASREQPWIAMGISRSTYYRRQKEDREQQENAANDRETGPSQLGEAYTTADGLVPTAEAAPSDAAAMSADTTLDGDFGNHPMALNIADAADWPRRFKTAVPSRDASALDDALKLLGIASRVGRDIGRAA